MGLTQSTASSLSLPSYNALGKDVIKQVLRCLWYGDYHNVRLVCKLWREIVSGRTLTLDPDSY
jgi:hypothetical protein